jgi:hypothetical protein
MKEKKTEKTTHELAADFAMPVCWCKRKRLRKRRKVSKPKRASKSLGALKKMTDAHRWLAMLTFKPEKSIDVIQSNEYQRFLVGLLRRELRGKQIGFLLVREFGVGQGINNSGEMSHFHVVLTDRLPKNLAIRIRTLFLNRCGLKNDPSRTFNYREHTRPGEPKFGDYVSKFKKDGIDTINPPIQWNYKKLIRLYHSGFLTNYSDGNNIQLMAS